MSEALAAIKKEIAERGIPDTTWNTLAKTLYPDASMNSVLMVWDYCSARKLDPLKKPVHIVPMRVKQGDDWVTRETIVPGIYEYRITAQRTGEYCGHDKPIFGDDIEVYGVKAPEWCEITAYRWNDKAQSKVPYTVRIYFREVCGTRKDKQGNLTANGRWERAPIQMLVKCTEAAVLREAFPEEIGGIPTMEEIEDHMPDVIDVTPVSIPTSWSRISDGLRENLEKAFTALKFSAAQRLTKVNEMVPNDASADEGAEKLLEWCRTEYAAQQGRTRQPVTNNKPKPESRPAESPRVVDVPPASAGPVSAVDPKRGASDDRRAGAEGPSQGSGQEAPAIPAEAIPFASTTTPKEADISSWDF